MKVRCLIALLGLAHAAAADVTFLGTVAFPGQAHDKSGLKGELAPGIPADVLGSHGSGIAWTGKDHTFLMVADRGPADGATPFRCRWHTITFSIEDDGTPSAAPLCTATTLLSDEKGRPLIGDAKEIDTGEGARRLDPEAIRVGPDGTVYVAEEYGPSVMAFSPQGKLLKRFTIPEKFLCKHPSGDAKAELPPVNTTGRVPNKGFEGLAISPAGDKLYAAVEAPLLQDGALDDKGTKVGKSVRILELPVDSPGGPTREFLLPLDRAGLSICELLAVNDHEFLALERDSKAGEESKVKRILKLDIAGATDIAAVESLPATGAPPGVKPVTRKVLIDLLNPKFGLNNERMPAKVEGLAFGPDLKDGRHLLLVTSDNDAKIDEPTWVWAFGVDAADLPGFTPQKFGK